MLTTITSRSHSWFMWLESWAHISSRSFMMIQVRSIQTKPSFQSIYFVICLLSRLIQLITLSVILTPSHLKHCMIQSLCIMKHCMIRRLYLFWSCSKWKPGQEDFILNVESMDCVTKCNLQWLWNSMCRWDLVPMNKTELKRSYRKTVEEITSPFHVYLIDFD